MLDALDVHNVIQGEEPIQDAFVSGKVYSKGTDLLELVACDQPEGLVPDVRGMGAKDAVYLLESKGLKVSLSGMGRVYYQSLRHGSLMRKGQAIELKLK